MKKNSGWIKSVSICLAVLVVMMGAGFYLLFGDTETSFVSSKVEAAFSEQNKQSEEVEENGEDKESKDQSGSAEEESVEAKEVESIQEAVTEEEKEEEVEDNNELSEKDDQAKENDDRKDESENEDAGNDQTSDNQAVSQTTAPGIENPENAPETEIVEESVETEPEPEPEPEVAEAVTYSWGATSSYTFRMEVALTNNGGSTANNVMVSVPLLENRSPYQTTSLRSVNYSQVSSSGRVSTFNLGNIAPGETKTIVADFDIAVRPVSINSSNDTIDKARGVFNKYAGSGNCRDLARAFIRDIRSMGIEAREVIGFARAQRGAMTTGSLQGTRHSWAEFYVEDLGWVPADLTFQYFGEFPHPSHIVESYEDQSISVNYNGGSLSASWSNAVH